MGKRGPKKGAIYEPTLLKREIRRRVQEYVRDKLDILLEAGLDSAKGHWALDKSDVDGTRVYEVKPDPRMILGFLEHGAGKLKEEVDVTSGGQPLQIGWMKPDDSE